MDIHRTDLDAGPIILLYREALQLHLKFFVGEGCRFLKSPTDPLSLYSTHSLRWLAQIVSQIIKAVGWVNQFTCEGIVDLADFNALVGDIDSLDPVTRSVQSATTSESVSEFYRSFNIVRFASRMDALLDLLDSMADALAAAWDQQSKWNGVEIFQGGKPTIQ